VGEPVIPPVKRLGISDAFALAHDVIGEELYQLRLREMEREGKVVTRVVTRTRRPGLFVTERRGREFFGNGRQRGMEAVAELRGVTR